MEALLKENQNLLFGKENPFRGKLVQRKRLTGENSSKKVDHITVSIEGSGMEYSCGDSLGIIAPNRDSEVEGIIKSLEINKDTVVEVKKTGLITLHEALKWHLALDKPSKRFFEYCGGDATREDLPDYLETRAILDILQDTGFKCDNAQSFVDQCRRLLPRLYSVASSPLHTGELVDLMVGVVEFQAHGRERWGVASGYLDHGLQEGCELGIYVAKSHFKLPEDSNTDVIMVGPGTGVAPFRGFLQERHSTQASGRNWLFFGDRTREHEYFYQAEWENFSEKGVLHKLDLAFSRDQEEKIYVQNRIIENGKELWSWINNGAHFYVCGDMKRMAKDVDTALHEIISTYGNLDEEATKQYVKQMKKDKRYQRDVY